ncbi:uncharacterized protein PFLUO_LOCUS1386 [Penicillium psychrofluorescens]|uniref:uncharacterized protein n=1 Tax=Penicillium psychrofluorescens TaxID=3158075 RepID=UPI003CCDB601
MAFLSILAAFGGTLAAYFVTQIVYNLYFHPLARFPGPPVWCALHLPWLRVLLKGRLPYTVKEYHDRYGPVVRISPDDLSFSDPSAWRDIYGKQTLNRPFQWGGRKPPGAKAHSFISAPAAEHARLRRAFNPAFSDKAVRGYEPTVTHFIDKLINCLRSLSDKTTGETDVDINHWLNYVFFDLIMELGWGSNFNCLENRQYNLWISFVTQLKAKLVANAISYYPFINMLLPYLIPPAAKKAMEEVFSTSMVKVEERLSRKGPTRTDIFQSVLEDPEHKNVSMDEMSQAALVIIAAGSETLTTSLSGTLNHLLRSPEKLQRLTEEVRSSFTSDSEINEQTARTMPYLNAVLKEGLRLCPPIPDNIRRLTPPEGLTIAGVSVPGSTTVSTGCWLQFTNPESFSHPQVFIPERWLEEGSEETANRAAFNPFGLGQRNCMGQTLAWVEMRLLMCKLFWNFDLKPAKGLPVWTDQNIFWFWDKLPLELKLQARTVS